MITNFFASVIYLFAFDVATDPSINFADSFTLGNMKAVFHQDKSDTLYKTVKVERGDTLVYMLQKTGVSKKHAYKAVNSLQKVYNPSRNLKVGQEVVLSLLPEKDKKTKYKIQQLRLPLDFRREVILEYKNGKYKAHRSDKHIEENLIYRNVEIQNSLFQDGTKHGVSDYIMHTFVKNFSYDIDFQRDIHLGDKFEVLYEELYDPERHEYQPGSLLYAAAVVDGKKLEIFRFKHKDGHTAYYNQKGQSIRKALLRTPVQTAVISSRFGMRKHPILGYTKMHRGVDFAAPTGTPIFAAGNGRVQRIGYVGGYGKYIKLKHNGIYSTAYGHMSRFARGLKKGDYVKQGEIIGYVGSTGRSTGPHLHFEVIKYGKQINPLNANFKSAKKLKKSQMKAFEKVKSSLLQQVAEHQKPTRYVLQISKDE